MKREHKNFIVEELNELCEKISQKKLSKMAQVSDGTISQMRNGNWQNISDAMWLKVKVNLNIDWGWQTAETDNFKLLLDLLTKAQKYSMSMCVSDHQGLGKTHAYHHYQRQGKNVILIRCKNTWKIKTFAKQRLIAAGLDVGGTTEEMLERFSEHMKNLHGALVIYDQFDKLKEPLKDIFMDDYDELDGNVGFLLSGVSLQRQEENGINRNKMGYRERYSRYGSKFIKLNRISLSDVSKICVINGVTDKEVIQDIYEDCEGDLRRVKRLVQKYFLEESEKKAA